MRRDTTCKATSHVAANKGLCNAGPFGRLAISLPLRFRVSRMPFLCSILPATPPRTLICSVSYILRHAYAHSCLDGKRGLWLSPPHRVQEEPCHYASPSSK